MAYLKKLVMHGFKSFATRTEIPFENAMNVIVGPNGSGKSNITDALCFVLGRLSIKSIRAAKAANLIFSGNKFHKPSQEATVELMFDNTDRAFSMDAQEISIKRIVRRNGLSIYKINNETKTRQELIELLAQAGIDPNGFNIVLQGEIASLIKLPPEERRKIIEEVAGISIYETRKHKSLLELEKTDEKLKEVLAILKERNAYLRNLDKERQEAIDFQKLEETIKRCKATILSKNIQEKEKDIGKVNLLVYDQEKEIDKIKKQVIEKSSKIKELEDKLKEINKLLQESTSNEQENLHKEIADLKAKLAGLNVRKENFELRLDENRMKKLEAERKIKELEKEISEIKVASPEIKKQQKDVKEYQSKFDILETQRRRFYQTKSEISTLENRKAERERLQIETKKEVELIERALTSMFDEIKYAKSIEKALIIKQETRSDIEKAKSQIIILEQKSLTAERENAVLVQEISREERMKQDIVKLDICPLCLNKITQEHINHVIEESNKKIEESEKNHQKNDSESNSIKEKITRIKEDLSQFQIRLNEVEIDIVKLKNAEDKKNQIIKITEAQEKTKAELKEINSRLDILKKEFEKLKNVESEYDETRMKLQELSLSDVDVDTNTSIKQRELTRLQIEQKTETRDIEETTIELKIILDLLAEAEVLLEKKETEEQQLYEKFQKFFTQRNELQDQQKAVETEIIGMQHSIRSHEDKINSFKIEKAKYDAEIESLKFEFKNFESFELIQAPLDQIREKLQKCQMRISEFGSVNMRALEAYEKVKEQVTQIEEKMKTIETEKIQIAKIIEEIDKKKKKSFMNTLVAVNEFFTRNFAQLSKKGEVFLDLENKDDPFSAGLNIIVKVARGKYFDVTSLSGGEQTLVALSLIFAIQEYKPYCFYIFDEIDAALDKHNSERLAALIKAYMKTGQYIVVTHNDALISEASALYGISMQENISKAISLKI